MVVGRCIKLLPNWIQLSGTRWNISDVSRSLIIVTIVLKETNRSPQIQCFALSHRHHGRCQLILKESYKSAPRLRNTVQYVDISLRNREHQAP